ncbi:MAG: hypothetical protein V5A23_02565 [Halobacteriales archaeon]
MFVDVVAVLDIVSFDDGDQVVVDGGDVLRRVGECRPVVRQRHFDVGVSGLGERRGSRGSVCRHRKQ